jgi:transcription elongation GreA/GreB family factor
MNKRTLIKIIIAKLREQMAASFRAARTAHEEATDESSKSEHKYDTRGLEAAYLAGAQSRQAKETEKTIAQYESLKPQAFSAQDPIGLMAVVELDSNGKRMFYFLGPSAGGLEFRYRGKEMLVITPQSPLGQNLMGKKQGDQVELKISRLPVAYRIVSVR